MIKLIHKKAFYLADIFPLALLFSCTSEPSAPVVCSAEFRVYSIIVLTPDGEPADSVDITVSHKLSGEAYPVCNTEAFHPEDCNEGLNDRYIIFHDAFDAISAEGETIIAEGRKGELHFKEEYIFSYGGCHIRKEAGADTVYLQPI